MTAEEYFAIALPTDADFKAWTKSLFARAERLMRRAAKRYPDLFVKQIDELAFPES